MLPGAEHLMAATNIPAHFRDAAKARSYLEQRAWPGGPVCPHCGGSGRISALDGKGHRAGLYFCGDCRRQFTVTVGSPFEHSKVPLDKWLRAIDLLRASWKGASARELQLAIGVTYKTAWSMKQRLQAAMKHGSK
jgi:transposase-like protein